LNRIYYIYNNIYIYIIIYIVKIWHRLYWFKVQVCFEIEIIEMIEMEAKWNAMDKYSIFAGESHINEYLSMPYI